MQENRLTPRIARLREALISRGFTDRSTEWFDKQQLPDVAAMYPGTHVIVRRAYAIDEMLKAMCDTQKFGYTHCFEIAEGDLLAGTIPMGSNGLGKVFPNYLTEEELRIGSVTNKNEMALLGHNTIDYRHLLDEGMTGIIEKAKAKRGLMREGIEDAYDTGAFYEAVIISCEAVIAYAGRFAVLAKEMASICGDEKRKDELLEISRICSKVPALPAETFYEAVHSIWLTHCCLHATMDYMSLGRLDQVLDPFLAGFDRSRGLELLENFIIKAAGRLNLTTQYLVKQDHMDYNAALGIHPYYLDQRAGLNNFLQNVIIGGKRPDGDDATNECTYLILEAFRNVNISTPGLYVRLHENSPDRLWKEVTESIRQTKNLPYILNDDVMIPALYNSFAARETDPAKLARYREITNDYCVDGCWEPILNGICDWTFGMINGMTILECTLNRGAALSSSPELLRGQKLSFDTGVITGYENLGEALKKQMQFFVDQSVFAMCIYYATSEFVVPTPLVSALFPSCLEKGRDKSWGGCDFNLGGTILGGVPDMINTVAAIKKWVFDRNKYTVGQVTEALRSNFTAADTGDFATQRVYDSIKVDFFTNSPQFGNGPDTDGITAMILNCFHESVNRSGILAEKVFMDPEGDANPQVWALRAIAGYYGKAVRSILPDFNLTFTAGLGTFEQYNWQGTGIAASAARLTGTPLAPNFTPNSGTWHTVPVELFETFSLSGMERFAAGVITDICLKSDDLLEELVRSFIRKKGSMVTFTIASKRYQEIYEIAKAANLIKNHQAMNDKLTEYADIMVRVGGWNAPFITLPLPHMENYINRPVTA